MKDKFSTSKTLQQQGKNSEKTIPHEPRISLSLYQETESSMFWNRNKISRKMIDQIRPTSKASLKAQCLKACEGDVEKAERLYAFMIRDMEDLPMFDILPPSTFSQVKESVAGSFNWIKENQADIVQGIQMIRALFGKGGGFPPAGSAPQVPVEPIPPIQ